MKKTHSVFIEVSSDELADILTPIFRKKGLLKDVPPAADVIPFDTTETSLEYKWEEEI